MIEKKPDSLSDIVDRAVGELRSSPVPPELPPELLNALLQAAKENTGAVQCTAEASAQAEIIRPAFPTHPLTNWRWIMRSPISRVTAAAIFVLAIAGVALWFHGAGTTPAFADFLEPILDAKTVTFKETWYEGGQKMTGKFMAMASPERMRTESETDKHTMVIRIWDDTGKHLTLWPARKTALVTTYTRSAPKEKGPKSMFFELRSQLADARDRPDLIRESLGEKEIDGRRLIGYRLTGHGMIRDLWGDPKTGMPARIEQSVPSMPNMRPIVCSDFVFNADLDKSLFSLEPPPGYKVQRRTYDIPPPAQEKDLIETFRRYGELCGGALPDQLDYEELEKLADEDWEKSHPKGPNSPSEDERQQELNAFDKLTRGISFAFERLPREADAHYAGKGIKLGATDTPIFWYHPKDSKKYRVIYADLSVREADTAPSVANAQPAVSASGPKK